MRTKKEQKKKTKFNLIAICILLISATSLFSCNKDNDETEPIDDNIITSEEPFENPQYTTEQTISDEAQKNTIAFDALGFMTGNLGSQTFLPPGKVADYNGFQYFRDNDQTNMGHNTSFVTIIAYNVLNILTDEQIDLFVSAAYNQIDLINAYAYKRFPLCDAFRRLLEDDLPEGTTSLSKEAVMECSAELYEIDGEISHGRAELFGEIINSLNDEQIEDFETLKDLKGIGNWPDDLSDPLKDMNLDKDINVAVMTYASEIYTWYAGSVTADVYFCPERQGTYFGSFYLKDWPAMGNPNYTINEQLTATAGQDFLNILTTEQYDDIVGLIDLQKDALLALLESREDISTELRKYICNETVDYSKVKSLSSEYGSYDGEIIYLYATYFAKVYQSLSNDQKDQLTDLVNNIGYVHPDGAFLYSEPIPMPEIENTDFLFK